MQLYAITDRHLLPGDEHQCRVALISLVRSWAQHNIDYIQIREKNLAPSDLLEFTQQIVTAVHNESQYTRVLLNVSAPIHVQIAFDSGTDGIHLPSNSSPHAAGNARDLFARAGRDAVLSHACHSREEVLKIKEGSQRNPRATVTNTVILYAPIFEKILPGENPIPGHGLDALKIAVENARPIPVFALGGITLENAPACLTAGATGIAAIRLFLGYEWQSLKKTMSS